MDKQIVAHKELMKLKFLLTRLKDILFVPCCDCGKPIKVFGLWVGNHQDCMPF